jgi:hypothetical protein
MSEPVLQEYGAARPHTQTGSKPILKNNVAFGFLKKLARVLVRRAAY